MLPDRVQKLKVSHTVADEWAAMHERDEAKIQDAIALPSGPTTSPVALNAEPASTPQEALAQAADSNSVPVATAEETSTSQAALALTADKASVPAATGKATSTSQAALALTAGSASGQLPAATADATSDSQAALASTADRAEKKEAAPSLLKKVAQKRPPAAPTFGKAASTVSRRLRSKESPTAVKASKV